MEIATKMDALWWEELLDRTDHLRETAVLKECLSGSETHSMRQYVMDIIAELARLRTNKYGYRVYIDGIQLENNQMVSIYDSPPLAGEGLEEWVERVFANKKFGMIINQGERFNLALSGSIALKLKPLLDKLGMPTEGIIFTLFIGNYDNTPLGIHLDMPGKSVMHFHLGPGDKKMYTWDTAEYEGLVGEQKYNNQDIQKYLPYAKEYAFSEGDIYFMPEDTYHVGTQTGLSMAVGCWFYNRSNFDFALRLQSILSEQYLKSTKENLKFDVNPIDDISALDRTLDLFEMPQYLESLSFKSLLKEVYKDLRYSLYSNGGYRTSPFPMKEDVYLVNTDWIELAKPFVIRYRPSVKGDKLHVFVRGIKLEFNNYDCLGTFIDAINDGNARDVKSLLSLLDQEWDESVGIYILSLFYRNHGIVKLDQ